MQISTLEREERDLLDVEEPLGGCEFANGDLCGVVAVGYIG